MKENFLGVSLLLCLHFLTLSVHSQYSPDVSAMQALKASLRNRKSLNWSNPDPCKWSHVNCKNSRVIHIRIGGQNLKGSLPPDLKNLSSLALLNVSNNELKGSIPSLAGLSSLHTVLFDTNDFSHMPSDFFQGLTSLKRVQLDFNRFYPWEIPESLQDATALESFSASLTNVAGTIPDFLGDAFPRLVELYLSYNNLQGQIPLSFANSSIQILSLGAAVDSHKLEGPVAVLQNMTSLTELYLENNLFTGPLPDLSGLSSLKVLNLNKNELTGILPFSLLNLPKLHVVDLSYNLFQGPIPQFNKSKVKAHIGIGSNRFCLGDPGVACDSRVTLLLSIVESLGYPAIFAESWEGNNPCNTSHQWKGISCDDKGNISVVNFKNMGLSGTISSNFSKLRSLRQLILSDNSLTGIIPGELSTLPILKMLDVSNNQLHGEVPIFRLNVIVNTDGNPDIIRKYISFPPVGTPSGSSPVKPSRDKNSDTRKIVGSILGVVCGLCAIGLGVSLCIRKLKCSSWLQSLNAVVIHPPGEEDGNSAKIITSGWSVDGFEYGNINFPIQALRNSTNNFNEENILGRGGFGTVYKGVLHDRTKIAVKRMESEVVSEPGLGAFKSEIEVLTKVRHRHLLALLGYCLDENERLLVYEYMPQGTLSRHLFKWKEEKLKPLEWRRRLSIALDVARGVEYLHGLAQQSFIHRDLKPSNILLGDDMRAKVADFGLVRLVPENIKSSFETRLAGTFGYLAPEYVVTGRVTKKVDVYSFGVILMELITGRKAVDATNSEDVVHIVTWFRNMQISRDSFRTTIDQAIELEDETLVTSIITVAELADQCCASDPQQRPDMGHAVNVLSSLAKLWRPTELVPDDINGANLAIISTPKSLSFTSESVSPQVVMEQPHNSLEVVFNE